MDMPLAGSIRDSTNETRIWSYVEPSMYLQTRGHVNWTKTITSSFFTPELKRQCLCLLLSQGPSKANRHALSYVRFRRVFWFSCSPSIVSPYSLPAWGTRFPQTFHELMLSPRYRRFARIGSRRDLTCWPRLIGIRHVSREGRAPYSSRAIQENRWGKIVWAGNWRNIEKVGFSDISLWFRYHGLLLIDDMYLSDS